MNMAAYLLLLAEEQYPLKESAGNAIFIGCFFLAVIVAVIWWLRR